MHKILMGLFFCCFTYFCNAQSIAFSGIPSVEIVEAGLERGGELQNSAYDAVSNHLITNHNVWVYVRSFLEAN